MQIFKKIPPRLPVVFASYAPPFYFVTFCARNRSPILANERVHECFRRYVEEGRRFNVAVGRYVIMPDHIHLFVRIPANLSLSRWVKGLKRSISGMAAPDEITNGASSLWQPGFFDHLIRNSESYDQKWNYTAENPVRASLVERREDWPFQGEIVRIDRA